MSDPLPPCRAATNVLLCRKFGTPRIRSALGGDFLQAVRAAVFGMSFAYCSARDSMMTRTEEMLLLMEVGIGVREAVFVTTGMLPLDVAESARADYEREIKSRLGNSFSEPYRAPVGSDPVPETARL
jgi:hypothetical protein